MDREARRQAAREAVLRARLESERPWWQRRLFGWLTAFPRRFWRWLRWWGAELSDGVFEVLAAWAALVFAFAVSLLVSWSWSVNPVGTGLLVAGAVAFLGFGGVEFFRERRRGRLAMIATAAFGFVALWLLVPLLHLVPALLS